MASQRCLLRGCAHRSGDCSARTGHWAALSSFRAGCRAAAFDRDTMAPMGCLPGDMDEDGRMDLLVYYWGRSPIAFLRRGAQMNAAAIHAAGNR